MPASTPSAGDVTNSNDQMIAFQRQMAMESARVSTAMAAFQAMMNASSKVSGR